MYFPHEVKGNNGGMPEETFWKLNEKCLFEFLRDYDICPSLLSKSAAFQAFQHTRHSEARVYYVLAFDILAIS